MSVEIIVNRTERKVEIEVNRVGIKGDTGKSAYQSYLDTTTDNPVLTEAEWSERAKGDDGDSAYQVWLDAGNTGTPQDFLDSLKGDKGENSTGYRGTISISDVKAEDGAYTPTESGTYPNAGGLTYSPTTTDQGNQVQFIKDGSNWVKVSTPNSFANKANQLKYNEYFSENEFGPINYTTGGNTTVNNVRLRSITNNKLKTGNYLIETISSAGIITHLVFFYKDGVFVKYENTPSFSINNATENEIRIQFRKPDNSAISQSELDNLKVIVYNPENVGYLDFQGRLKYIEDFDVSQINDKVNQLDSYNIPKIQAKTDQLFYNLYDSMRVLGRFNSSSNDNITASTVRAVDTDISTVVDGLINIETESNYGIIAQTVMGYKDGIFVPNAFPSTFDISDFTIDTDIVNGVKLGFRKSDNSVITQSELNELKVSLYQNNYTGYDRIKNNIKTLESEIKSKKESVWYGKKLTVLGDSISWGYIPSNSPDSGTQADSYAKIVSDRLGMILDNRGVPGSTIGAPTIGDNTRSPFVYRYGDIPNEQDLIVVMGGTNDIRFINNLGTFSDTDETSYYGALHMLCLGLLDKFRIQQGTFEGAKKHIVLCTPIRNQSRDLAPYAQAVKEIGEYYCLPIWDAFNLSGINPFIHQTVIGTDPTYNGNYNPYITDGTHPTPDGQKIMADAFQGFLNTIN